MPAAAAEEKEEEGKEKGFSPPGADSIYRYTHAGSLWKRAVSPPKKKTLEKKYKIFDFIMREKSLPTGLKPFPNNSLGGDLGENLKI